MTGSSEDDDDDEESKERGTVTTEEALIGGAIRHKEGAKRVGQVVPESGSNSNRSQLPTGRGDEDMSAESPDPFRSCPAIMEDDDEESQ